MSQVSSFTVGETYTNDQIRFALDVENLGGIRPALDAKQGYSTRGRSDSFTGIRQTKD
jgi:hypothetical protein